MITRRDVMTGGIVAGALKTEAGDALAAPAAPQRGADEKTVALLTEIRDELRRAHGACNANDCQEIERVRNEQRVFLKGRNKFPDYLDVGADIWDRLCDWHVKNQVPLQVTRLPEGRYSMPFYQTFIILRPDVANSYLSQGYDK